jgi:hypothetical protein
MQANIQAPRISCSVPGMFTATVGYVNKRNENEHVHEHCWPCDTTGCPSPLHQEECCNEAVILRCGRGSVENRFFTQSGTRFKSIAKRIFSPQIYEINMQQKCLGK